MTNELLAKASIDINANPAKVWQALTDPKYIKEYMFGTEAKSDWKQGSPITFVGEWEGKNYEDKGTILKIEQEKVLQYSYWSSMGGKEDKPENYGTVTYSLTADGDKTHLEVTQTADNQESQEHGTSSWQSVLQQIKQKLEA